MTCEGRAVQDECGRIESDFGRVWRDYRATGKSRRGYDETVKTPTCSGISDGRRAQSQEQKPKAKRFRRQRGSPGTATR